MYFRIQDNYGIFIETSYVDVVKKSKMSLSII